MKPKQKKLLKKLLSEIKDEVYLGNEIIVFKGLQFAFTDEEYETFKELVENIK